MNTCNNCKHAKTSLMAEPCYSCYYMSHWERPTNADRIRAMSDEELANMLSLVQRNAKKDTPWLDWLKQEEDACELVLTAVRRSRRRTAS